MEAISVFCVGEKINKTNLEVVERIHKKYKEYFSSREYIKPDEESESIYIEFTNGDNILHIFLRGEEFEVTVQRLKDLRKICESTFKKCSAEYLFDVIDNIFKQFIVVKKEPTEVKEKYELEIPEKDEHFYFRLLSDGSIAHESFGLNFDIRTFKQGNYFSEESEAKLEAKRRKLMTRFKQFRDKCNGDWKPDFREHDVKYYIVSNTGLKVSWVDYVNNYVKFGYFKNKEDCIKAIEIFGGEIKELF